MIRLEIGEFNLATWLDKLIFMIMYDWMRR